MKKSNYLGIFASVLSTIAFTACEKSSGTAGNGNTDSVPESISVVYNGFSGYDGSDLSFREGDKIGIYAVDGGTIVPGTDNLCLTAVSSGDGSLSWQSEEGGIEISPEARYFAYYPYDPDISSQVNADASGSADFFSRVITGKNIPQDQSSVEKIRSAMFMTAEGQIQDGAMTFQMNNEMSMAQIELPVTVYRFTNSDRKLTDYTNSLPVTFTDFSPLYNGRTSAVILFNPSQPVKVSGTALSSDGETENWEFIPDCSAGEIYRYAIGEGNTTVEHLLQVGDFFLADGNILSKDESKSVVSSRDVIGIVFQLNPDRIGQTEKDALGGDVHGLVVAAKNAGGTFRRWYMDRATENFDRDETEIGLPDILVEGDPLATFKLADADISGYSNSLLIKNKRSEDYEQNNYPSIKSALEFADEIGGPQSGADVSGWFLPSNGQWFDILRGLCGVTIDEFTHFDTIGDDFYWTECGHIPNLMNAAQEKIADDQKDAFNIGDCYWTSSAASPRYAREIDMSDNYMDSMIEFKINGALVRPVFVF